MCENLTFEQAVGKIQHLNEHRNFKSLDSKVALIGLVDVETSTVESMPPIETTYISPFGKMISESNNRLEGDQNQTAGKFSNSHLPLSYVSKTLMYSDNKRTISYKQRQSQRMAKRKK